MNDIKHIINNLKNNHDNFITMILDVESEKEMFDNITLLKTLVRGTNTITITGHGNEFDLTVNGRYITGGNTESIVKSLHHVMTSGYLVEIV